MTRTNIKRAGEQGFSLLEMLVVVAILMIVMAVVFGQVQQVQKRYHTEEAKLDITQEAREFMDQMVRDVHQAGFPPRRMFSTGVLMDPWQQDARVAAGLVSFSATDLRFEADVDGDGQVESVRYRLLAGAGNTCPCVLQRSQVLKINATAPMDQITSFSTGLDGVVNSGGAGGGGTAGSYLLQGSTAMGNGVVKTNQVLYGALAPAQIFTAFDANGVVVPAADIVSNPNRVASVQSIAINLNVLVRAAGMDMQTHLRPALSLSASARISNN